MVAIDDVSLLYAYREPRLTSAVTCRQPKENTLSTEAKCPFSGGARTHTMAGAASNAHWWPNQLNLKILHQHSPLSNPLGEAFNYA